MGTDTGGMSGGSMAGLGVQALGAIIGGAGSYKKSAGEQQAYEFQSQVAKNNAVIADQQAKDAILRGQTNEQNVRQRTANLKSSQRASMAARGLDMGEGSPLDILTSTDVMGERDALLAHDNAAKEVWGLQNTAANYRSNAALLDWRAGQQSPLMDAGGTLLAGAGKVASSWYTIRNQTAGTGAGKTYMDLGTP